MKNIYLTTLFSIIILSLNAQTATLSGEINSPFGELVEAATISVFDSGDNLIAVTSGSDFTFPGLNQGETYKVVFEKNEAYLNGVSTFDIVMIIRHILAIDPIASPYLLHAADVNFSTSITAFDIVLLRRLILAIDSELPVPSWQFLPAGLSSFSGVTNYNEMEVEMTSDNVTLEVIGFKMGDINGTAIPD